MASSNGPAIHNLAEQINRSAKSIPFMYLGLGLVTGFMLGVALGGSTVDVQRAAGIAYGIIGSLIGWSIGRSHQASLRLQALTAVSLTKSPKAVKARCV